MIIVPKKFRESVYTELFKEGVMVINEGKIDFLRKIKNSPKKKKEIVNLTVTIMLLKSLLSKGLVDKVFSWKVYYFILNEKGVSYLRTLLNIPSNVVPRTHKRPMMFKKY